MYFVMSRTANSVKRLGQGLTDWRNRVPSPEGTEGFLLIAASTGDHLASFSMSTSGSFSEGKTAEREDDHSSPFSAESNQNSRVYATAPRKERNKSVTLCTSLE
jgi:hypothetical protein